MSEQDNIAAVKESFEAFNRGDLNGAVAAYAEDAEVVAPTGPQRGKAQILAALQGWRTAFPDVKAQITNQVASADQVATEVTFRATHTGPLAGPGGTIPATGKSTTITAAFVQSFRNGKVQSERDYYDMATLMQQLGLSG